MEQDRKCLASLHNKWKTTRKVRNTASLQYNDAATKHITCTLCKSSLQWTRGVHVHEQKRTVTLMVKHHRLKLNRQVREDPCIPSCI